MNVRRAVGGLLLLLLTLGLFAASWLLLSPPALLRVGTGYAAKAVCSNVFLAARSAGSVLREEVQAPDHPILPLIRARVDREAGEVRASLLGVAAPAVAVHRPGLGCALVPRLDRGGVARTLAAPEAQGPALPLPEAPHSEIQAILDDAALLGPGFRAVVILHRGAIIAERYAPGYGPDTPLSGWSMTKTVLGALVGIAARDGRLSLEQGALFPEWEGDPRRHITVAHLMGMESGLRFNEEYGGVADATRMLYLENDMARFAARFPLEAEPGTRFNYSSGSSLLLSRLWQDTFDDPAEALAWPRRVLFEPLGMDGATLEADAVGTFVASSYLFAPARDWARFGEFLRVGGVWNGERILPEGFAEWMREAASASRGDYGRGHLWLHGPGRASAGRESPDVESHMPPDAFWLAGHDGQSVVVLPSAELVIVRMGLTPERLGYRPQRLARSVLDLLAGP